MYLCDEYVSPPSRHIDDVDTSRQIVSFLNANGVAFYPRFFFKDGPGATSPCQRVLRVYPEFQTFLNEDEGGGRYLSNLPTRPDGSMEPPLIQMSTLIEIMKGVPKRFPFFDARIVFDQIDWESLTLLLPLFAEQCKSREDPFRIYRFSGIQVSSEWGVSQRRRHSLVHAFLPRDCLSEQGRPPTPKMLALFLDSVGKHRYSRTLPVLSALERERYSDLTARSSGILKGFSCPSGLLSLRNIGTDMGTVSFKESLKVLKDIGWRRDSYRSGQGLHQYKKMTIGHNLMRLMVDHAPMTQCASACVWIDGPGWSYRGEYLPLTSDEDPRRCYDPEITNQNQADILGRNLRRVLPEYQSLIEKEAEPMFPETPEWFFLRHEHGA